MARRPATVLPFHGRKGWHGRARPARRGRRGKGEGGWLGPIMVMLPLAAFTAVFLWDGPPPGVAMPFAGTAAHAADRERASFAVCSGPERFNCVVDGDTFWYGGEKIRIAGLNAPEVSAPECAREAALGEKATGRLTELLNAGPFTLEPADQETDRYGRTLRRVTRAGVSLGATLEAEGLAVEGRRYRGGWC